MGIKIRIGKFRRVFAMLATVVLCVAFYAVFSACGDREKETKYDVAIRIGCSDGKIYEFPVGTEERHITIPYDGTERTFWVNSYNLPDHPRWSDNWFSPSGEGANVFGKTMSYCPPGGLNQVHTGPIKEIGEYCIVIEADSTSDLWKFRAIYLFVTII